MNADTPSLAGLLGAAAGALHLRGEDYPACPYRAPNARDQVRRRAWSRGFLLALAGRVSRETGAYCFTGAKGTRHGMRPDRLVWSADELRLLSNAAGRVPLVEVARHLGRSYPAVRIRLCRLRKVSAIPRQRGEAA